MTDRNLVIRVVLVLVAIVALLGVLASLPPHDGDAAATLASTVPVQVVVSKPVRPSASRSDGDLLMGPPYQALRLARPIMVEGQLEPLDATAFRQGRLLIRLRHLAGPSRDAVCHGEDGAPWGCGLQARAALVNALRADAARCLPALDTPGETNSFECWVGEKDLSRMMIRDGWARPMILHQAGYAAELAAAMAQKAGLWRGTWPEDAKSPAAVFEGRRRAASP